MRHKALTKAKGALGLTLAGALAALGWMPLMKALDDQSEPLAMNPRDRSVYGQSGASQRPYPYPPPGLPRSAVLGPPPWPKRPTSLPASAPGRAGGEGAVSRGTDRQRPMNFIPHTRRAPVLVGFPPPAQVQRHVIAVSPYSGIIPEVILDKDQSPYADIPRAGRTGAPDSQGPLPSSGRLR